MAVKNLLLPVARTDDEFLADGPPVWHRPGWLTTELPAFS